MFTSRTLQSRHSHSRSPAHTSTRPALVGDLLLWETTRHRSTSAREQSAVVHRRPAVHGSILLRSIYTPTIANITTATAAPQIEGCDAMCTDDGPLYSSEASSSQSNPPSVDIDISVSAHSSVPAATIQPDPKRRKLERFNSLEAFDDYVNNRGRA